MSEANLVSRANDPFVQSATPSTTRSQLSPTADVFTPRDYLVFGAAARGLDPDRVTLGTAKNTAGGVHPTHGRVSSLVATSVPEVDSDEHRQLQARIGAIGEEIGNLTEALQSLTAELATPRPLHFREAVIEEGTFTNDESATRALMITGIPTTMSFAAFTSQFNVSSFSSNLTFADLPCRPLRMAH